MENAEKSPEKPPEKEAQGRRKKSTVVVGLVCVAALAIVLVMNSDRMVARFAGSEPTGQELEAPTAVNAAPVILGVMPATDRIAPLDRCQLICEAEDADGDVLTYTWGASQGDVFGEGATIEWGAPDVEGIFRLSVSVDDGSGGVAEYSTSLRVKNNYAPEIQSMSASDEWVLPGSSTYISSAAVDADGDAITYEWEAAVGEVFGEGHSIVWVAPTELGSYRVAVFARDAYGGEATREIPISVTQGTAPELGSFVVEAIDHNMLQLKDGVWDIFQGRSCSVTCMVVEGAEPFTYTWTADWGTLIADGVMATWDAPKGKGPATITVDVTDVNGNTTTGTVLMSVETCTCHFN